MKRFARCVLFFAAAFAQAAPEGHAQATLPQTSLASWYQTVKAGMPRAGSNAYVQPSQAEADAFRIAIARLLSNDVQDATTHLAPLGYEVSSIRESSGATYLVASEKADGFKGRGTYVVNPAWERNLALEAPHPLYDLDTGEEALLIFTSVGARMLAIAGTHRCASAAPGGCSGTTSACTPGSEVEPYRVSDMAHSVPSFFQSAHQATVDASMTAISVHGKASTTPDVELSDGTSQPRNEDAPVNRLRAALLARGIVAASCNWPADGPVELCGGTNVQSRFTNGSPDPCSTSATNATGTFFHLEQDLAIRRAPEGVVSAIASVIPVTRGARPRMRSVKH